MKPRLHASLLLTVGLRSVMENGSWCFPVTGKSMRSMTWRPIFSKNESVEAVFGSCGTA